MMNILEHASIPVGRRRSDVAQQEQELEQRLESLYQRSLKGDAEAFAQAAQLATNALKNVQQVKSAQAEALRQRLEHFLGRLRSAGSPEAMKQQADSREIQREELNRRVLAGDPDAVNQAALTTFGQGEIDLGGRKLQGKLGIVFQCCLLFIEEGKGGRAIHILAKPGELKQVSTKGFLSKKTLLTKKNGETFAFSLNRKQSTVDEAKRHDNLQALWPGLGL